MILRPLVWEDPPDPTPRGGHRKISLLSVVAELRARPNTWARVAEYTHAPSVSPTATHFRWLDPRLHVVVVGYRIYARWLDR